MSRPLVSDDGEKGKFNSRRPQHTGEVGLARLALRSAGVHGTDTMVRALTKLSCSKEEIGEAREASLLTEELLAQVAEQQDLELLVSSEHLRHSLWILRKGWQAQLASAQEATAAALSWAPRLETQLARPGPKFPTAPARRK